MPRRSSPHLIGARFLPDAALDFDAYPLCIPAVRDLEQIDFHPNVTFFVGENGAGKSTVLEALAIALGFSSEGGTRHARVETVGSVSPLHEMIRVARGVPFPKDAYFLRAESLFNVATYMDAIGSNDPSLHRQSHGEAFMQVLAEKLRGKGLYLLDEPEAALSPSRQLTALRVIDELVKDGSQFVIATHSPILLSYRDSKIVLFDAAGVSEIAYEDTEHFAITKDFLNHYPRRLRDLLSDED